MYIGNQKHMQTLDQFTMNHLGLPGIVLMENAGASVANEIQKHFQPSQSKILVITGSGNNGGDGFVIARRLIDLGYQVALCLAVSETRLKGDAKVHFNVYKNRQLPYFEYEKNFNQFTMQLQTSDLVVDALLGTGISGAVRSPFKEIIEAVNEAQKVVYAVDIPSGVNANTGEVANIAINATKTITFALPKLGFFLQEGPQYIGDWTVADISVPIDTVEKLHLNLPILLDKERAVSSLPKRVSHGHKGTFGHCLVIGGCTNYIGAPQYTSKAAFHTGVGLVTLAIPKTIYSVVASQCPESLYTPLEDYNGSIASNAFAQLDFTKFKSIAFGPGIGRNIDGTQLLKSLFSKLTTQPIVIDADGIYFFKNILDDIKSYAGTIIVTPHPGEMATLTGLTVSEIEKNRLEVAKQFATNHGVYLLLKGHRSIIASPNGDIIINPYGNDALGKGGSGDVLTGMIVSFLAQGAHPLEAMQSATYFHAIAAQNAGREISNYGVNPMDIIQYIAKIL